MSRSLLVMDTPENCSRCQFGEIIEWGKIMCNREHRSLPMVGNRPHWCPLIPEPERADPNVNGLDFADGWNSCLDAFEGKND